MRPVEQPAIRLSRPHCCVCAQAEGGICGHIGPAMICDSHLTNGTRPARTDTDWIVMAGQ